MQKMRQGGPNWALLIDNFLSESTNRKNIHPCDSTSKESAFCSCRSLLVFGVNNADHLHGVLRVRFFHPIDTREPVGACSSSYLVQTSARSECLGYICKAPRIMLDC